MQVNVYPLDNSVETAEYTTIKNLRFAPTTDVISDRVPINGFECDIVTDTAIPVGYNAELIGPTDTWFTGRITFSEQEDERLWHVEAKSLTCLLDRVTMPAAYFNAVSLNFMLSEISFATGVGFNTEDNVDSTQTITGFCEEQNARERLQHTLIACGLYIKDTFVEMPTVAKVTSGGGETIPVEKTYWKPKPNYQDYVTEVKVRSYSFTQRTPSTGDQYVTDAYGDTYVYTTTDVTLSNQSAPAVAKPNTVEVTDVMLMTSSNAATVASMLATYYFKRMKVSLDVINNGEYKVGNKYTVFLNDDDTADQAVGYMESADFGFGTQSKSSVTIGSCDTAQTKKLVVKYVSQNDPPGNDVIRKRSFNFPVGYNYTVENPFTGYNKGNYYFLFRPKDATLTGTMSADGGEETVKCYAALRKKKDTSVLRIISVDEVNRVQESSGGSTYYVAEIE